MEVFIVCGHYHKPQIIIMIAFVVVIDFGKITNDCGHRFQFFGRYRHCGKGTDTDTIRMKHGADPADYALGV